MKKKVLFISIIFAFVFLLHANVFASTHTLEEIVEKFNSSNTIKNYGELLDCEFSAYTNEFEPNILLISIMSEKGSSSISYELNDSILSYEHLVDDNILSAYLLVDAIGQVNGYKDGEVLKNLDMIQDEIADYTIEDDGFEMKQNESYYHVKMDIDKKITLKDEGEFFFKVSEFDIISEMVKQGESGNQSGKKAKLAYDILSTGETSFITIGEKDEITSSTYKSILSALEAMYGEKVVDYFKSVYPDLSEGNMLVNGFDINVDEEIDLEEHPMFADMKIVTVEVDNEYINDEFLRTDYIGETVERGDKTLVLDFTKNKSYKLGFFDSATSSDAAFIFKYLLEPIFVDSEAELENDDTAYFNIVDGKIVVGNKDNSVFKLVIRDEYLELIPTKTYKEKTTLTANHKEVKVTEYQEGKSQEHFRYGNYNLTVNVICWDKLIYEVVEAPKEKVNVSNGGKLTFRLNIDFATFKADGKVYIDGKLVDEANYTATEGSTIITFKDDFAKTISSGEHTLKVVVADGEVTAKFAVVNNEGVSNPKTGDNIMAYMILFVVSLIGSLAIRKKAKLYVK